MSCEDVVRECPYFFGILYNFHQFSHICLSWHVRFQRCHFVQRQESVEFVKEAPAGWSMKQAPEVVVSNSLFFGVYLNLEVS